MRDNFFDIVEEGIKSFSLRTDSKLLLVIGGAISSYFENEENNAWQTLKDVGSYLIKMNPTLIALDGLYTIGKMAIDLIKQEITSNFGGSAYEFIAYQIGVVAFDAVLTGVTGGAYQGAKVIARGSQVALKVGKTVKSSKDSLVGLLNRLSSKMKHSPGGKGKVTYCEAGLGGCFVKDTPVLMASNANQFSLRNSTKALAMAAAMPIVAVPIQEVQLLDYAVAHETVNSTYGLTASVDDDIYLGLLDKDPYTSDQQRERDEYEINDTDWNEVVFEEVHGSSTAKLALHNDWIYWKGYQVDGVVTLDLPEKGISGPFRITSIKHIIPQKKPVDDDVVDDYDYRPVTALFTHESNQVYNIDFDNGESLGVTYQHPIFSTTLDDWKLAGELEIGEQVLTKKGEATVTSSIQKEGSETVYNLEVKELHNFLVGESGVVVHNNCLKVIAKQADINDLENAVQATGKTQLGVQKTLKEVGDAGTTGAIAKGGKLTKAELFALWAKARKFEAEHALTKVKSLYTQTGQRVTLKVTKTLPDGTTITKDIVPDFVVKDGSSFKIIDAKFTTKADADFTIKSSLTKNQNEVFDWMKNGDNISIKVTANQSKLNDLGILTGDNISVSAVDILKSKTDDLLDSDILNYF